MHRLAEAAQRVQQGDYTRHVDVENRDEIGQLAVSFNHMLDGIVSREKEILRLAYEDGLTGLPNRAMFYEQLEQAARLAKRGGHSVAVMLLDMDRFKAINDTLGHTVGDQALREVGARRAQGAARIGRGRAPGRRRVRRAARHGRPPMRRRSSRTRSTRPSRNPS